MDETAITVARVVPDEHAGKEAKPRTKTGGIKDTIESILIAFILAFIFRAFVVEAFVIPTGSMAPTLLGAHMRFRCADCGYEFTVNYSSKSDDAEDVNIPRFAEIAEPRRDHNGSYIKDGSGKLLLFPTPKIYAIYCPNCGFKIGDEELSDPDHDPGAAPKAVTRPPVHYGDRILVLKYQYLFQDPRRWDVVVFKAPTEPEKYHYSQNYIKRLVGKPGESIMVLDGDVYKSEGKGENMDEFHVQTKPRWVQEAMWRVVYDNDYHPRQIQRTNGPAWKQPWTSMPGSSGWAEAGTAGRQFDFSNPSGSGTLAFNPDANPNQSALTDWLAYDVTMNQAEPSNTYNASIRGPNGQNAVSDLKLSFFYDRISGDGPLELKMSKLDHVFTAQINPDSVRLIMKAGDGVETEIGKASVAPSRQPLFVEFTNVDYRVTLRINGKDLITTSTDQYHPDIHRLMDAYKRGESMPQPGVQIVANREVCSLSHVGLWRDIYYISHDVGNRLMWGIPDAFPSKVVHLSKQKGQEEYFVLGDNSIISGDARYWTRPVNLPDEDLNVEAGRVPARFMLGKAFFVYWPAGFRPFPESPGVAPDFGDMRFIH